MEHNVPPTSDNAEEAEPPIGSSNWPLFPATLQPSPIHSPYPFTADPVQSYSGLASVPPVYSPSLPSYPRYVGPMSQPIAGPMYQPFAGARSLPTGPYRPLGPPMPYSLGFGSTQVYNPTQDPFRISSQPGLSFTQEVANPNLVPFQSCQSQPSLSDAKHVSHPSTAPFYGSSAPAKQRSSRSSNPLGSYQYSLSPVQQAASSHVPSALSYPVHERRKPPVSIQEMLDIVNREPQQKNSTIWSGQMTSVYLLEESIQCTVTTSQREINSELKPELWPAEMLLDCGMKTSIDSRLKTMSLSEGEVWIVFINFMQNPQSMVSLSTIMKDEGKIWVGVVKPKSRDGEASCPLKAFILVWNEKRKQFVGLIPIQQEMFVQAIKDTLEDMDWYWQLQRTPFQLQQLQRAAASTSARQMQAVPSEQSWDTSDLAARRCYEEALQQGFVESSSVVVAVSGAAGSGKTHVRHLIFSKPPPSVRRSTGLECPIRAISLVRVDATHEEWQEISDLEQCKILADALAAGVSCTTEDSDPSVDSEADVELRKTEDSHPISEADVEQDVSVATPANLKKQPASSTALPVQPSLLPADYSQLILELQQYVISLIANSSGSKKLMDANFINFLDTGGQLLFHELLPYFAPTIAVTLFVTKLNESLDQRPIVEYYGQEGKPLGKSYRSPLSHKDILRYSFRAIQSHACIGESQTTGPKLLVVGTHRDKESECSENRRQKNQKLLGLISTEFKKSLLFYGEEMEELIFPVNAKSPKEEDRLVAKQLRRAIITVASSLKRTKTPISWHMLEIALRRLATDRNKKILSRKECLEVAKILQISEGGLSAALEHLHGLLRILYYPRCLPNLIFINPQIVLNKLTELVRHSHKLRDNPDKSEAIDAKWLKFRDEGVITIDFLESFPDDYSSDTFTPSHLLQILSHRLIAAEISEGKYYLPCILPNLSDAEVEEHRVAPSSPVAPWVIYFPGGLAPSAVFCALIASLLSPKQVPCKWQLLPEKSKPKCFSRNCISFIVSNIPGKITLIDSYTHFEVHISAPLPFSWKYCQKYCPLIRGQILSNVKTAFTTLNYVYSEETAPKDAFLCKHKDEDSSQGDLTAALLPHPAEIHLDGMWWSCTLAPDTECGECVEEHLVWFASSPATEFQPVEFNESCDKHPGPQAGQAPSPQISVGTTASASKEVVVPPKDDDITAPDPKKMRLDVQLAAKYRPTRTSHDQEGATEGLNKIPQRSDKPRLQELQCLRGRGGRRVKVIEEVAAKWEQLALALHFQPSVIEIVRRNKFHQTEDACREVLMRWLEGQGETRQPVNWATLIDSLLEAGFVDVAEDLQELVEDPLLP